ncbi:MAG: hypothetical protein ACFCUQ_16600 [Kiloniellales bacterium]
MALQAVSLTAVVVPGAAPLNDAAFTVTKIGPDTGGEIVAKSSNGPAVVELPTGRYRVVASYGHSKAVEEILVGRSPLSHEINLNAGTVQLKLIKHVGGPTMKQDVKWEILTFGRDAEGKRHFVAGSQESQPRFVLREGFYLARATVKGREVRHTIEVTAGVTYKYNVILQ